MRRRLGIAGSVALGGALVVLGALALVWAIRSSAEAPRTARPPEDLSDPQERMMFDSAYDQRLSRDAIPPIYTPPIRGRRRGAAPAGRTRHWVGRKWPGAGLSRHHAQPPRDGQRRRRRHAGARHLVTALLHRSRARPALRGPDAGLWQPGRAVQDRHDLVRPHHRQHLEPAHWPSPGRGVAGRGAHATPLNPSTPGPGSARATPKLWCWPTASTARG